MAWPSSGDVDTTKFDQDTDKISESRPELEKMAGYVNDMIDAGGAANTFSTVNADGTNLVADSTNDTLNIVGGTNITITGNASSDTLTISATGNAAPTTQIFNGTSNVSIPASGGNINFVVNGNEKMRVNNNAFGSPGVIGIEMFGALDVTKVYADDIAVANITSSDTVSITNLTGSSVLVSDVSATGSLKVPNNTRTITNGITGAVGQIRAISDEGGSLVFWDTDNTQWSDLGSVGGNVGNTFSRVDVNGTILTADTATDTLTLDFDNNFAPVVNSGTDSIEVKLDGAIGLDPGNGETGLDINIPDNSKGILLRCPSSTPDVALKFDGSNSGVMTAMEFTSVVAGTPSNTSTPSGWIKIIVNGNTRYLPYYA